jgi:hypothetical protein
MKQVYKHISVPSICKSSLRLTFIPVETLLVAQRAKKFLLFYGTRRFTTFLHKTPPLVPILNHMKPFHKFLTSFHNTYIPTLFSHLCLGVPSGFPTKNFIYSFLISPMRATCPSYLHSQYFKCHFLGYVVFPLQCMASLHIYLRVYRLRGIDFSSSR